MKNLTRYVLAAALFASPALLVQAAEQQPADARQPLAQQDQNAPQTTPVPSEQGGGNQSEANAPRPGKAEGTTPPPDGNNPPEGAISPNEPTGQAPEQPDITGGPQFIEQPSGQEILAGTLMGYSVTNLQGENLGRVEDLILDQDLRPVGVVISAGGFLGLGAKHVAIPMSEAQVNRENKIVQVSISKEALNKAPPFSAQGQQQQQTEQQDGGSGSTGEQ